MTEYSEVAECLYCGRVFLKSNKRHKYCSSRCKEAARIARLDLHEGTCKGCGAPITYKLIGGKPSRQYCSRECQLKHTIPTKICTCMDCGVQFEFRGRTTKLRCDECLKKFKSKCVMQRRALKDPTVRIGIGSGGGQMTDDNAAKYADYKGYLRAVARSRYRLKALKLSKVCDICGYSAHEEALVVHHKDMNRLNNEVDNLVVICANCHMLIHSQIKKLQKEQDITSTDIYNIIKKTEIKSRNEAGTPDRATRTEGCMQVQSGATHSSRSLMDISCHEAATDREV